MSIKQFRYSSTLKDHDADVRGLCISMLEQNGLYSCSRDKTTKLWIPSIDGNHYESKSSYIGHKKFVSCVTVMDPIKGVYPEGLILTGSNDKTINLYLPYDEIAILSLEGHTNVISNIKCGVQGKFYSSSWDQTARVWQLDLASFGKAQCVNVLNGHAAAVWDIALLPGKQELLTASADKTVKLWLNDHLKHTFTGHTDCVRGLCVLSSTQFLSCSNDATIKRWGISGDCLQTYYGHKSFVYSIDISPDLEMFVTSGEDQTVKVWTVGDSNPVQTLPVPALSAWKVIVLRNGDLAVGCSDGSIRIFTFVENRMASEQEKLEYEEELSKLALPESGLNLGDVDAEKLRGPEALLEPGQKDGQTLLIRNASVVEAYHWSDIDKKWVKIGDVVGSSGGNKSTYQGKEYDYVFTVDILEGAPPLHLPYNLSEDPWFAAQKFIDDNDLSQQFLDRVANFIIDNTNKSTSMQVESTGYADPYTGQGRYVPTDTSKHGRNRGYDPFTGSGRYLPAGTENSMGQKAGQAHDPMVNPSRYVPTDDADVHTNSNVSSQSNQGYIAENKYFPKFGFIFFETQNHSSMFNKLKENSMQAGRQFTKEEMLSLQVLLKAPLDTSLISDGLQVVWEAISWQASLVFPVLDLIRCVLISNKNFLDVAFEKDFNVENLLTFVVGQLQPQSLNINKLLAVRILCNLFSSIKGTAFVFDNFEVVIEFLKKSAGMGSEGNNNLFIAIATLLVNFSVSFNNSSLPGKTIDTMRQVCIETCELYFLESSCLSTEAFFRFLVGLGTLLYGHELAQKKAAASKLKQVILAGASKFKDIQKVSDCSNLVMQLL